MLFEPDSVERYVRVLMMRQSTGVDQLTHMTGPRNLAGGGPNSLPTPSKDIGKLIMSV
jgi:hypothetical protein